MEARQPELGLKNTLSLTYFSVIVADNDNDITYNDCIETLKQGNCRVGVTERDNLKIL